MEAVISHGFHLFYFVLIEHIEDIPIENTVFLMSGQLVPSGAAGGPDLKGPVPL